MNLANARTYGANAATAAAAAREEDLKKKLDEERELVADREDRMTKAAYFLQFPK